ALQALVEAAAVRGGGVFLPGDEGASPYLVPRAAYGVPIQEIGPPLQWDQIDPQPRSSDSNRDRSAPRALVELVENRLLVPLLFRNQPLGALALLLHPGQTPDPSVVEFARQAAAQLAIALSNARAYARVAQLAYELTERNQDLQAQRDQIKLQRDQMEQQGIQLRHQRDQMEQQRDQLEQQSM